MNLMGNRTRLHTWSTTAGQKREGTQHTWNCGKGIKTEGDTRNSDGHLNLKNRSHRFSLTANLWRTHYLFCTFRSSSLFCFFSLRTCREQHDSHELVAEIPGAEAQRDQRHKEGEQGEGHSPQQQGQCGDLPVWDTQRPKGRKGMKSHGDRGWRR